MDNIQPQLSVCPLKQEMNAAIHHLTQRVWQPETLNPETLNPETLNLETLNPETLMRS
jgi:hypothetical protein